MPLRTIEPGIINGRRLFDQSVVPTNQNRGDIWRERDGNGDLVEEWFWNGTYWLSEKQTVEVGFNTSSNIEIASPTPLRANYNLYLQYANYSVQSAGLFDDLNYWQIELRRMSSTGVRTVINTLSITPAVATAYANLSTTINTHFNVDLLALKQLRYGLTKVGNPGTLIGTAMLTYQFARQ